MRPIADAPYPFILVEYKNEMKTFHTVAGRGDELCESRLNEEDVRMTAGGARYNGVALLSRDGQNAKDVVPQSEWHRPVVGPKAPLVDSWQGLWQNDHPAGGVYSENDFATAGVAVYDTVMFWFGADNTGTTSENCQNWNQYASDVKHTLLHGQGNRIGLYDFHGQTTFGCTNSRRFLCVIY